MSENQTAVAKAQESSLAFAPENVNQAWRLARTLAESSLVPTPLKGKPADILVVLMSGRELGMPPMQSMRHLYVIEGRISMSAQMVLARVRRSPECEHFTMLESDAKKATFATRRRGSIQDEKLTFTIDDAAAMNLVNRDNWKKQPATMLRWRAVTALCRLVYSDLVEGIYSEDEAEDMKLSTLMQGPPITEDDLKPRESEKPIDVAFQESMPDHDPETGEIKEASAR